MIWTEELERLCAGGKCSGSAFLTLMEPESDDALDEAFTYLTENAVAIDLSDLPRPGNTGASALRLKREEELARKEDLISALEETDPLRIYLEEIAATPTAEDPQILAEKAAQGDELAAQRLVSAMLGRVMEIAREYTGWGVLLLDLCQEGGLALWEAILRYESGNFEELCLARIRQAMAMAVLSQLRAGGIGQKLREGMEDYRDMDQQLLGELGRNPTLEEIAERLHLTVEETRVLHTALENAQKRKAVDDARAPKEEDPDEEQAVENTAYFQSRQRILELMSALTDEDKTLISLRFGLEGGLPLSPEDTADRLGLTPEEVIKRESAALTALRGEHQNG